MNHCTEEMRILAGFLPSLYEAEHLNQEGQGE